MDQANLHSVALPMEEAGVIRAPVSERSPHAGTGLFKPAWDGAIKREYSGDAAHYRCSLFVIRLGGKGSGHRNLGPALGLGGSWPERQ